MWVLARGDVSTNTKGRANNWAQFWPPAVLLDQLFRDPSPTSVGGGFGWKRPWLFNRGQRFARHDPYWTTVRCYWFAADRAPYEP
jgi:hypothetical protein